MHSPRGDDGSSRSIDIGIGIQSVPHEQHEIPNEEFDDEGNVVKVENLEFIPGILGQGAFGTVRLARRHLSLSSNSRSSSNSSLNSCNKNCSSPVSPFRRAVRSYSFDEAGESDSSDRYTAFRNDFMTKAHHFSLFRSRSGDFADEKARDGADNKHNNNNNNDQLVAVKIFSKSNLKRRRTIERDRSTKRVRVKTALQQVEREIALMKKLSHPNLVRLYEVINSPETDSLYMVLEYMPLGEILTFRADDGTFTRSESLRHKQIDGLVDGGHFDEEHAALYIVDILHGLAYLHQHHICHRDLKPENILLSDKGIAKVGDFGVSHIFEEENSAENGSRCSLTSIDEDHSQRRLSSNSSSSSFSSAEEVEENPFFLTRHDTDSAYSMGKLAGSGILTKTEGTWCFWSPEMCDGSKSIVFSGYASDMWAVGVCLYIFVTGKLPFYNTTPMDLFEMIANCDVPYSGLGLSDPLIDLLKSCLEKDPNKRAGVGDCLHHPFLQNAREQRIRQLGPEFEISRKSATHISEDDIRMAFRTVTSVPVQVLRSASKKIQEGLAHTRDNLKARIHIPSLASTIITSGDVEGLDRNKIRDEKSDDSNDPNKRSTTNPAVFYIRQVSGDSGHFSLGGIRENENESETEHNAYELSLPKKGNESETDTHVSRISSGMSLGSTITDDLNPKEFTSRFSFGSHNTDDLPMIVSEEDGNRTSTDDDTHNHNPNPPLDMEDMEG